MLRHLSEIHTVRPGEGREGADASLVPHSELHDLADLPLLFAHLSGVYTEGATVGHLIEVGALPGIVQPERFQLPFLAREPRQDTPLDIRQVSYYQLATGRRADCRTEAGGHQRGHVSIQQRSDSRLKRCDAFLNLGGGEITAGQVLRLE